MKPMRALAIVITLSFLTRVAVGGLLIAAHYEIETFVLKYFVMLVGVFFISSSIQRIVAFIRMLNRQS